MVYNGKQHNRTHRNGSRTECSLNINTTLQAVIDEVEKTVK